MFAASRIRRAGPFAAALLFALSSPAVRAQSDAPAAAPLVQQLETPLSAGDVAVTGFSGVSLATPNLPAGVDPASLTMIDGDGVALRIFDLSTLGGPTLGQVIAPPVKLTIPARDIGQVFALTFDDGAGLSGTGVPNLYAASTSLFGLQIVGAPGPDGVPTRLKQGAPGASFMAGQFGALMGANPGAIWKIDGTTGAVTHFADTPANGGPGVGDLAIDSASRTLYASDLDTGLIHRFSLDAADGADLGTFDHGMSGRPGAELPSVADDGAKADITSPAFKADDPASWGFTQPERRVNALAVHGGRLYYSVAAGPEIWSVELGPDGGFAVTARRELAVKADQPLAVTDIVFDDQGRMILAERGTQKSPFDFGPFVEPAAAATLRYMPAPAGGAEFWLPDPEAYAIGLPDGNRMGSGGIALHRSFNPDGSLGASCRQTLLTTGDDLRNSPALAATIPPGPVTVHGIQINDASLVDPANVPPLQSAFAAFDPNQADPDARGRIGDVEAIPCLGQTGEATPGGSPPVIKGGFVAPPLVFPGDFGPLEPLPGGGGFSLAKQALTDSCTQDGGCAFGITLFNPGPDPLPGPFQVDDIFTVGGAEQREAAIIGAPSAPWTCTDGAHVNCIRPGPLPVGKTVLTLNFKPGPLGDAREVRNCVALAGELGDALPPVIEEPNGPVDPAKPDDQKPAATPLPTESDKNGLLVKTTPVNAGTCSAAKGDCQFKIELVNTGQAVIKGPLVLNQSVSLGGGNAPKGPFGQFSLPFDSSSQQLPAGIACKPEAAAVNCSGNVDIQPGGTVTMVLGVSPKLPAGSTAGFATNSVIAKIGALDGAATASHGFVDAAKDGAKGDGGKKPGDLDQPGLDTSGLPPQQCATIAIANPKGGGGGKTKPSEVAGLTIEKTASKATPTCGIGKPCTFDIKITNTAKVPSDKPIVITDTPTSDGELKIPGDDMAVLPAAPWTCSKGFPTTCQHPGPIAPGKSLTMTMGMTPMPGTTGKTFKNCALLKGGTVPSCATIAMTPPPATTGPLVVSKEPAQASCAANGDCRWIITIVNNGQAPVQPVQIEETVSDGTGAVVATTELTTAPAAPWTCEKGAGKFLCKNPEALAPNGKLTFTVGFRLGIDFVTATAMKNCAGAPGAAPVCKTVPLTAQTPEAKLRFAKVADAKECSDLGGGCAFKLVIGNSGPGDFVGPLKISDVMTTSDGKPLPDVMVDGTDIVDGPGAKLLMSCGAKAGIVSCQGNATLPAGQTSTIRLSLKPGSTNGAKALRNCATIENGGGEQCATIALFSGARLKPIKDTVAKSCVPSCDFVIRVQNTGNADAPGPIVFNDVFEPAASVASIAVLRGDFACTGAGATVQCTARQAALKPGEFATGVVTVTTKSRADIYRNCFENQTTIPTDPNAPQRCVQILEVKPPAPPPPPPDASPNIAVSMRAFTTVCAIQGADFRKSATGNCLFEATFTNMGPAPFEGTLVFNSPVGPIRPLWHSQNKCGGPLLGERVCEIKNVNLGAKGPNDKSGGQVSFVLDVEPGNDWKKNNTLEVCAIFSYASVSRIKDNGKIRDDDKACASQILDPFAVKVSKSGGQNCRAGENCTFALTLFNPGPIDHHAPVTLADKLDIGTAEIVSSDIPPEICPTAPTQVPFSCTSPGDIDLPLGGTPKTFTVVVKMPDGATRFSNCASVSAPDGAGGPAATTEADAQSCVTADLAPKDPGFGGSSQVQPQTDPTPPPAQCFGGMAADTAGRCACPAGTRWNGRICASSGAVVSPTLPPAAIPCPNGTQGTYPNCRVIKVAPPKQCPSGTSGRYPKCRPIQTERPQCPDGTTGRYPKCRPIQVEPQTPVCPDGTTGRYPRCRPVCPPGSVFSDGACVSTAKPACPDGTIGRYPRCRAIQVEPETPTCPDGTTGRYPRCRPIRNEPEPVRQCPDGTSGVYPDCARDRPEPLKPLELRRCLHGQVGTPPNCSCPAGTRFRNDYCRPIDGSGPDNGTKPTPAPVAQCTGDLVGTPPNCRCPGVNDNREGDKCFRGPK